MFANRKEDLLLKATAAGEQLRCWEKALSLRVSLQPCIDHANKFPVLDEANDLLSLTPSDTSITDEEIDLDQFNEISTKCTKTMNHFINQVANRQGSKAKKPLENGDDLEFIWSEILKYQTSQQKNWEDITGKLYASVHFDSKSRMKTFDYNIWQQVRAIYSECN